MGANYVQGLGLGIQVLKLFFLKHSEFNWESGGKRIDHALSATLEICTEYPRFTEESVGNVLYKVIDL